MSNKCQFTDSHFLGSDVDFHAVETLLSGVYYTVLYTRINESTFCGIDINTGDDLLRIEKPLKQIVDWTYANGSVKNPY